MNEATSKQAIILVSGHVQGVFFRAHAQEEAMKLGLTGYARNLPDRQARQPINQLRQPDKQVEILLQGPRDKILTFIEWAKTGSPKARVTGLKITWQTLESQRDNFLIK